MKPGNFGGMNMNMGNLMKQAQKLQQEMAVKQAELQEREFTSAVGGGAVTATVKGQSLVSLSIKPEAVDPDDVEMLQDLIVAAVNEALKEAAEAVANEMKNLTGGMGLPPGLF
ncbi:MAG: YbaB/EbfC family nucleoid-associated protein [Bacillota bacterium]|nr:YbaB/EbfC family nucleoid-associated protein [Bacillota bacterium]